MGTKNQRQNGCGGGRSCKCDDRGGKLEENGNQGGELEKNDDRDSSLQEDDGQDGELEVYDDRDNSLEEDDGWDGELAADLGRLQEDEDERCVVCGRGRSGRRKKE
jgi:hypothetical protein